MSDVFIRATKFSFESAETLADLEAIGQRLKNDQIATRAEKRLLRDHYVQMRQYLIELGEADGD